MKNEKTINLGFKYRLYPTKEQEQILNHQMFIYNQAYNICLNLWQKEYERNNKLDKEHRTYRRPVDYDRVVKRALKLRKLPFSTVVTQQARINFLKAAKKAFSKDMTSKRLKAIKEAKTPKEKVKAYSLGMPKFKSSKDKRQSFNWNNQGYKIIDDINNNPRFRTLKLLKTNFRFRYHRELPENYKLISITISKDSTGYFVSFGIEFKKQINSITPNETIDTTKCIGIDLNTNNIAVSSNVDFMSNMNIANVNNGYLIDNGAFNRKSLRYSNHIKVLMRKQSRRVFKALKEAKKNNTKTKLGGNYKKTQKKINKLFKKIANQKNNLYHKISTALTDKFDMIAVEALDVKNMTKSSKGNEIKPGKSVKQKSRLNRAILNASFYQFLKMLEYKAMRNGKLFVHVDSRYTSQECVRCGCVDKRNRPKQDVFKCITCGFEINPDIQASLNVLKRGMDSFKSQGYKFTRDFYTFINNQSFGLGTSLVDYKHKAFRSETEVSVS